ncbi:MAG: hypothetical protein JW863_21815 [Chitinispirillaceae bacterium]|nr:hypothetical protein [Chitinispirillaceae bacterium]
MRYITMYFISFNFLFSSSFSIPSEKEIASLFDTKNFAQYEFDRSKTPSAYELSLIHFILRNTHENNIHQMRGEEKNKVYIKTKKDKNGYSEAVYNENGILVTNSYNQGSFNFHLYSTEPIKHFGYDMLPWLEWGNTRDDPTSFQERLFHYSLDLSIGIQTYIFEGTKSDLAKIDFSNLSNSDKMIYRFFSFVLFNKNYEIKLNEKNKMRLKNEAEFYWAYFDQIQSLLKVNNLAK